MADYTHTFDVNDPFGYGNTSTGTAGSVGVGGSGGGGTGGAVTATGANGGIVTYGNSPGSPALPLPYDGMVISVKGKPYRYMNGEWEDMLGDETVKTPNLPVVLDASKMLTALKAYKDFLYELLMELSGETQEAVKQTMLGLDEAIEGLEKI